MLKILLVCIIAGAGAGLTTGFAGLSAAVFITPLLVTLLDVPVYQAVGIALASDVLASAVSAYTYARHGNIDLKHGRILLILVLAFTLIGSFVAYKVTSIKLGDSVLSYWSIIGSLILGLAFMFSHNRQKKESSLTGSRKVLTVLCGIYIGFVCGFQGTGGGMMLLFTLTVVMLYEFKAAVGTSVFIMALAALIGSAFHFWINGFPDVTQLVTCVISTTVFARIGAVIANRMEQLTLKRITGVILTISCFLMLILKIWG